MKKIFKISTLIIFIILILFNIPKVDIKKNFDKINTIFQDQNRQLTLNELSGIWKNGYTEVISIDLPQEIKQNAIDNYKIGNISEYYSLKILENKKQKTPSNISIFKIDESSGYIIFSENNMPKNQILENNIKGQNFFYSNNKITSINFISKENYQIIELFAKYIESKLTLLGSYIIKANNCKIKINLNYSM